MQFQPEFLAEIWSNIFSLSSMRYEFDMHNQAKTIPDSAR